MKEQVEQLKQEIIKRGGAIIERVPLDVKQGDLVFGQKVEDCLMDAFQGRPVERKFNGKAVVVGCIGNRLYIYALPDTRPAFRDQLKPLNEKILLFVAQNIESAPFTQRCLKRYHWQNIATKYAVEIPASSQTLCETLNGLAWHPFDYFIVTDTLIKEFLEHCSSVEIARPNGKTRSKFVRFEALVKSMQADGFVLSEEDEKLLDVVRKIVKPLREKLDDCLVCDPEAVENIAFSFFVEWASKKESNPWRPTTDELDPIKDENLSRMLCELHEATVDLLNTVPGSFFEAATEGDAAWKEEALTATLNAGRDALSTRGVSIARVGASFGQGQGPFATAISFMDYLKLSRHECCRVLSAIDKMAKEGFELPADKQEVLKQVREILGDDYGVDDGDKPMPNPLRRRR